MPRQPLAAHARLFDVDVNRRKRIDATIDYFGAGSIRLARDPYGESLLDETGRPHAGAVPDDTQIK
jgi:hypothetical protein